MVCSRLLALLAATCAMPAVAAPELAAVFRDNSVLQRDKPVPVWGRALPGEHVTVAFAGQTVGATAGADGHWITVLAPLAANAAGADLTVAGKTTIAAHGVVVGEVWLCAGGSSMDAGLDPGGQGEVAAARFPLVRQFDPGRPGTADVASWRTCSPEAAGTFTAVGYYFARELASRLGLPLGILKASSPGSALDQWMSPAALAAFPAGPGSGAAALPGPADPWAPSSAFHALIEPLLPYALRGTIWYQGEVDVGHAADYAVRFPAMITALRSHFGQGDVPFFWVQLAGREPADRWARLREAQSAALDLPATGQAIAMDVGEGGKREVARRLALIAKATVYSIPVDYSGPVYSAASVEGASMRVTFNFAGEGLTASGKPLQSFEIAGADRVFHAAAAAIRGGTVVVQSPLVRQPVAVRYAWRGSADGNLYNGAGLPAPPFRSDDW